MKIFLRKKEMSTVLGIIAFSVIIAALNPNFLSLKNIKDIVGGSVVLGIVSLGMMVVITAGGIDISVGAAVSTVSAVIGYLAYLLNGNILLIFIGACMVGTLIGFINGFLVSGLNASPLVVTLAMASILRGLIRLLPHTRGLLNLPGNFISFGNIAAGRGISVQTLIFMLAIVLNYICLKYTRAGRGVYAVGENESTALRVGYHVKSIKMFIYVFCGLMAGIAGFAHTTMMKQVNTNGFAGFEFQVIAAVILGGVSIMGGEGSIWGTLLGVLFFSMISNGLIMGHIPVFWQDIVVGCVIVLMISYDVIKNKAFRQRLSERIYQ